MDYRNISVCFAAAIALSVTTLSQQAATKDVNTAGAASSIDFNRDIRAILSDNCFTCHGPDEKERKAKMRLDDPKEALKPAKSGDHAIVPGDAKNSQLIARITTKDSDDGPPALKVSVLVPAL